MPSASRPPIAEPAAIPSSAPAATIADGSAREMGHRRSECTATGNVGWAHHSRGRLAEALTWFRRHLELSREIGFRSGEAIAASNLGCVAHRLGRLDEALRWHALQAEIAAAASDRRRAVIATACSAQALLVNGREADADARFAEAVRGFEAMGDRHHAPEFLAWKGLGLFRLGRIDEADADLARAHALAVAADLPAVAAFALCVRAAAGRAPAAEAVAAFDANEPKVEYAETRMEARWLLWLATRDPVHLAAAREILDDLVEHAPAADRDSMLRNVPVHRAISGIEG